MKKVLLIEPSNARDDPFAQCWYTPDQKKFTVPNLALPILAALTPEDFDVKMIDEKIQNVDVDEKCDLACFTFKTKDAFRAYHYAAEFKKRGVPVILGGMHASLIPEEASQHADAVIVGEAEGIWAKVLNDFQTGKLEKIYRAPKQVSLETQRLPRFELLQNEKYCLHGIQTSRGCLVGCEFCPIQEMFEGRSRNKSIDRVLREIEAVRRIDPIKDIFFTDEMFCGGNKKFQQDLLKELRRNKVNFYCISDFKVMNPKYIWELANGGCKKISINMPGTCLPQELKAVKAIQKLGIDVWGFFMFGFSFHDNTVFQKVVDFVHESAMKNLTLTVMSPFPNTPMSRRIDARNGIFSRDWSLYDQCHVAYEPERMSAKELETGFHWAWGQLERHLYIQEKETVTTNSERSQRAMKRWTGAVSLGVEKGIDLILGRKEEPVDLEKILGVKKVEVSVTTHNVMGDQKKKSVSTPANDHKAA